MAKSLEVDRSNLEYGFELIQEILKFRPYTSISFQSSDKIINAVQETKRLAKWGFAKNRHKMKAASINILDIILSCEPEEPVNLNLSKYELKSLKALAKLIKQSVEKQKDGLALN